MVPPLLGPAWPSPRRLAVKRLSYSHCSHGPRRKAISLPAHICMPCHACGNPLTHSLLQETPVGTPSPGWAGLAAGNGENMPACAVSPFPALTISLLQCWAGFFFFFFSPQICCQLCWEVPQEVQLPSRCFWPSWCSHVEIWCFWDQREMWQCMKSQPP